VSETQIGTGIRRLDGRLKVTGAAKYAADNRSARQMHAVLVGSPIAAGTLTGLDTALARAVPGVVAVLGPGDLPKPHERLAEVSVPPLATRLLPIQDERIVHHGQPVAVVVAETLEAAEYAATLVAVAVVEDSFVAPGQAPIEEAATVGGYAQMMPLHQQVGKPVDAGAAPVHLAETYTQPDRHNNPMEPSAIVAEWDGDTLTVTDSAQHIYAVQSTLAAAFGLDDDKVRVLSPHTGGGFGAKAFIWPHEIIAPMVAKVVGKPIKLVLTRAQMYSMVGYQPAMWHDVALGAETNGALAVIRHDAVNTTAVTEDYVEFGAATALGLYASPSITTSQRVRRGNVNLPTFMRSPLDGPGTWALGSAVDELARATGIDPLDLRLINHADTDPGSGKPWTSKKLIQAYGEGARRFGWRTRPTGGSVDGPWRIGCGVADATQGQFRFPSQARLSMDRSAKVTLEVGFTDIGQGPTTIFPQVAASVLGLEPEAIQTRHGDTDLPFAGPTYGSGTTIGVGAAVLDAAQRLRAELARLAGWPEDEVSCALGELRRGEETIPFGKLVAAHGDPLTVEGSFVLPNGAPADAGPAEFATRTFGVVFVEVGVDPELGLLRLRRATGVYSAGRIINERTARSQMIGGIVWGWGMAALEASEFEPDLGRWHSQNLAGVALPVNADIPTDIDIAFVDEFDEHAGPLGAKGIGELSATGTAAAVANAVYDAVGIRIRDLPITPAQIVNSAYLTRSGLRHHD
jgi:xanthine dehydrogenase YagR molybdenum-binding subunit